MNSCKGDEFDGSGSKKVILELFRPLMGDETAEKRFKGYLISMGEDCITREIFRYGAQYEALVPEIPEIFRLVSDLIASEAYFQRLCRVMPVILQWLPYTSEESWCGYSHSIDLNPLKARRKNSSSFGGFIDGFDRPYPVIVCRDCGRDMEHTVNENGSHSLRCRCGALMVC